MTPHDQPKGHPIVEALAFVRWRLACAFAWVFCLRMPPRHRIRRPTYFN
ncbi:hypothetical protein MMA231_04128 (plasmid) [Asticcacaulis sp. MM231]